MATQVRRPRRCPVNRLQPAPLPSPSPAKACRGAGSSAPCRRTSLPSPSAPSRGNQRNSRRNRSARARSGRLGRNPESKSRRPVAAKSPGKKLVVEEVALLKPGEAVKEPPPAVRDGDLAFSSTDWLGPDPEILPKQTRLVGGELSFHADLCFLASPSPSSLPFPASFFAKKDAGNAMELATKGLQYLLRLDPP